MGSFTNQERRIATPEECKACWGGHPGGKSFRCYLCGHKFQVGDGWCWIYGKGKCQNFFACDKCDGPDAVDRFVANYEEAKRRFWWLFLDLESAYQEVSHAARVSFEAGEDKGYREGLREGKAESSW